MKSTLISATLLLTTLTLSAGARVGNVNENHRISLAQWSLHRNLGSGDLDNLDFPRVAAEESEFITSSGSPSSFRTEPRIVSIFSR